MRKVALILFFITITTLCFQPFEKQERLYQLNGKKFYMTPEQLETLPTEVRSKVEDAQIIPKQFPIPQQQFPTRLTQQAVVRPLLSKIEQESPQRIKDMIKHLTSYGNRHYNRETGLKSAEWLRDQYQRVIDSLPSERKALFNVSLVKHSGWMQPSIIVTLKGSSSDETVILGGHIDTVAVAPGADDNGSGTSTVFETFRLLATSNFVPKRTIEFHGYAAEEVGALGSRAIAQMYQSAKRKVIAYLNTDMNGYNSNNKMAIDSGRGTSLTLRQFLMLAAKEYVSIEAFTRAYFGGSDHSSWYSAGFHSANAFESNVSPHWHRATDVLENVDTKYISEFVKLTTGYAVELSMF